MLLALLLRVLGLAGLWVLLALWLALLPLLRVLLRCRLVLLVRVRHSRLRSHLARLLPLCALLVGSAWLPALVAVLRVGLLHRELLLLYLLVLLLRRLMSHEHLLLLLHQVWGQLDLAGMHSGVVLLHLLYLLGIQALHALLHPGHTAGVVYLSLHRALL